MTFKSFNACHFREIPYFNLSVMRARSEQITFWADAYSLDLASVPFQIFLAFSCVHIPNLYSAVLTPAKQYVLKRMEGKSSHSISMSQTLVLFRLLRNSLSTLPKVDCLRIRLFFEQLNLLFKFLDSFLHSGNRLPLLFENIFSFGRLSVLH